MQQAEKESLSANDLDVKTKPGPFTDLDMNDKGLLLLIFAGALGR